MNAGTSVLVSLIAVICLALFAFFGAGSAGLSGLFGGVIPPVAFVIFVLGVIYRVVQWARSPVPFRIPTTCGQGYSLPWIKAAYFESPWTRWGLLGRMAMEVFLFRSLFRNTKAQLQQGPSVVFASAKWLWLFGILFHYSFLVIIVRHMRFFIEPIPSLVALISSVDGFFQILLPTVFLSDLALVGAATYLFLRRVALPQMRYISLPADYFPLFLVLGIALSGILMRNVWKVDLVRVKQLAMGWATFHPGITIDPQVVGPIGPIFFVHLFLVSVLVAYLPFSKIMHVAGVFMSPTRNMRNVNRMEHYENPWNKPVKVHTYEEYEDDFRVKMIEAGIPVEKKE